MHLPELRELFRKSLTGKKGVPSWQALIKAMQESKKEKYKLIDDALKGDYVLLHMNTSSEQLCIPDYLKEDNTVTLKFSRLFRGDLQLNEESIEADLLFNGDYFHCVVPFESIWGLTNSKGKNLVWPGFAPPEILLALSNSTESGPQKDTSKKAASRKKAKSATVASDSDSASDSLPNENPAPSEAGKFPARGHLKRIK